MSILITGAMGFIGSQTAYTFLDQNQEIILLDRVSPKHLENLREKTKFYQIELLDKESIRNLFKLVKIKAVIHFAANIEVGESQMNPEKYYYNNVLGSLNLLSVMKEFDVKNIVFSSTAAVYGNPKNIPITENSETKPINTYGRTKFMTEMMISDFVSGYGFSAIALRYFNACGSDPQSRTGENHNPESHLIPIILQTALGIRKSFDIYGNDYNTKDGSCVRDYINVMDLAEAHILAVNKLISGEIKGFEAINLGTGSGFSVKEILEEATKITNKKINFELKNRRSGDPETLVADNQKAKIVLGWEPKYSDLKTIIETAWNWILKKNQAE
jgi:UDP-glucose 4-epimerase